MSSTVVTEDAVTIVGGGAAGTLAAIHLLRARPAGAVTLVERSPAVGRGVAYGSADPRHLLNVAAGHMAAYADRPDHLVDWLRQAGHPQAGVETYAPRLAYGAYLADTLEQAAQEAAGPVELQVVEGDAVAARRFGSGLELELADGRTLASTLLVLATGPVPSRAWPLPGDPAHAAARWYVADPWRAAALDAIGLGDRVVLVGTGLTMVDVAISLADRGVTIEALSRHGLLPLSHISRAGSRAAPRVQIAGLRPRGTVRELRRAGRTAAAWQDVIDGLRPRSNELWQGLSLDEQEQFLRHLRRYWDAHRHRIAPATAAELEALLAAGTLRVRAATVVRIAAGQTGVELEVAPRGGGERVVLHADVVVNCTGPGDAIDRQPPALLASLFAERLACPGPHRLGLGVTERGEVAGSNGMIYALGALRRGQLWETVAIGEIRAQAAALASAWATKSPKLRR